MNKEFIPYEQALELKQLGFDEPCLACYDKLNMLATYTKLFEPKNYNTSKYCISAPLYQQAFRWFREKYNLYMDMLPYKNRFEISIRSGHYLIDIGSYTTYEEAELECLKKLIEIVKN